MKNLVVSQLLWAKGGDAVDGVEIDGVRHWDTDGRQHRLLRLLLLLLRQSLQGVSGWC